MTYQDDCTLPVELLEQLTQEGLEGLLELERVLVNEAIPAGHRDGVRIERQNYLGTRPYERSPHRRGRANGYKPKSVKTRLGEIRFDVPRVGEKGFYPQALEKGIRSERALLLALAEMYVQGVSTRKVAAITEQLCGTAVSSAQVSRSSAALDEVLEAWRQRRLGEIRVLYLDARYEKVRVDGQIRDVAILIASGVMPGGKRQILGVSVSLSEAEVHWRMFLQELVARGMRGVQLVVSDDHAGLEAARRAVHGGVPWQRCQFHLQQNALQYVPRKSMRKDVAEDIRTIIDAPDRATAEAYLARMVAKYARTASKLSAWLEDNIPEGLTVFDFPKQHWRRLRTTNNLEPACVEQKRRTKVIPRFLTEQACLKLVFATLWQASQRWRGVRMSDLERQQLLRLRAELGLTPPPAPGERKLPHAA
jgi:transposase-like protein